MRLVRVGTVLHHRWMLIKKWTAPLCVAGQAHLVCRACDKLLGIGSSVRVVAARAGDFAFAVGHVRTALQLRAPHLVALQAEFRLLLLDASVLGERCIVANV